MQYRAVGGRWIENGRRNGRPFTLFGALQAYLFLPLPFEPPPVLVSPPVLPPDFTTSTCSVVKAVLPEVSSATAMMVCRPLALRVFQLQSRLLPEVEDFSLLSM